MRLSGNDLARLANDASPPDSQTLCQRVIWSGGQNGEEISRRQPAAVAKYPTMLLG
jgi:hypothetical protein